MAERRRLLDSGKAPRAIGVREEKLKLAAECVYCGEEATSVDHLIPQFKNGPDAADNLVPACQGCNSSKGSRDAFVWAAGKGFHAGTACGRSSGRTPSPAPRGRSSSGFGRSPASLGSEQALIARPSLLLQGESYPNHHGRLSFYHRRYWAVESHASYAQRRGQLGMQDMHRDVIEEVFLHAFEAGMALVQLRPHPGQVDLGDRAQVPRHLREALQVLP